MGNEDTRLDNELRDVIADGAFPHLFLEAEKVRWRMCDIPWNSIDKKLVSPAWVAVVSTAAMSEQTTFSATDSFFKGFPEDVDFTSWLSVWLYEETKHPLALMRWLQAFDVKFDSRAVLKGRQTLPFMRSKVGMIVTNVYSEVLATALYMTMAPKAPEPILKQVFKNLGGDEARHAAHFYAFAKKRIEEAEDRREAVRDALKVLYYWLDTKSHVHPVNLVRHQLSAPEMASAITPAMLEEVDHRARNRMLAVTSSLVGTPLKSFDDVVAALG
jgi:hypothetical protein